jgi:hypothetical protein
LGSHNHAFVINAVLHNESPAERGSALLHAGNSKPNKWAGSHDAMAVINNLDGDRVFSLDQSSDTASGFAQGRLRSCRAFTKKTRAQAALKAMDPTACSAGRHPS